MEGLATLPRDAAALSGPGAATLRARAVRRAAQDLRAGTPVVLEAAAGTLVLLAAETATGPALAEFRTLALPGAVLLRGVAPDGVSVTRVAAADLDAAGLRGLGETGSGPGTLPAPAGAAEAVKLARIALLLPSVMAAPLAAAAPGLLRVRAADIAAFTPGRQHLARVVEAHVPLADAATCRVVAFRPDDGGVEHLAVLIGRPEQAEAPLVRLHSECFTGDLLGSLRCDCGPQLHGALRRMAAEGAGVLLYMAQEGRGIGLVNKLRAYALQDAGLDTLEANLALGFAADERSFAPAAEMLRGLGITRIRLLTNNPQKLAGLAACGIEIAGRVSHFYAANGVNDAYLATKARRFGHLLD